MLRPTYVICILVAPPFTILIKLTGLEEICKWRVRGWYRCGHQACRRRICTVTSCVRRVTAQADPGYLHTSAACCNPRP